MDIGEKKHREYKISAMNLWMSTSSSWGEKKNMNSYKYVWVREGDELSSERWQKQKRPQIQIL